MKDLEMFCPRSNNITVSSRKTRPIVTLYIPNSTKITVLCTLTTNLAMAPALWLSPFRHRTELIPASDGSVVKFNNLQIGIANAA